ncbi:MAG TPA: APC family permease, partial [Candidatus Limnocylindria bacterium]|nr:APC family permease [Candidatus Limnocylindria bacterium]
WGPAAAAAGGWLLIGLLLAAGVAYCNAVASAQLAAQYPTSGGTYVYGRERLGPAWGFLAGWGFVIGKTASSAAMALTFAAYLVPQPGLPQRLLAVAAVIGLTAVNYRGITRTAGLARVLVMLSIAALALFVAVAAGGALSQGAAARASDVAGVYGVMQSAGLLFFAFAGYARIATLGEEVREPARTIPRAIPLALGITVVIYLAVGAAALAAAGAEALADSTRPLATAVEAVNAAWALPVVQVGAVVASLGALLALIAGVGRTTLAMARNADLPTWLASVHPRFRVPDHAELALAFAISILVLTTDLRGAIGFSSFGVLIYYAIANAAAFTQANVQRRWPRFLNVAGLLGCLLLVVTLPIQAVLAGTAMFAVGLASWLVAGRLRRAPATA